MTGFGKDPVNPFSNNLVSDPNYHGNSNPMYSANRQPPIFEFNAGRLFLDPNNTSNNGGSPGFPATTTAWGTPHRTRRARPELLRVLLRLRHRGLRCQRREFPGRDRRQRHGPDLAAIPACRRVYFSPSPNPYSTTLTANLRNGSVVFEKRKHSRSSRAVSTGYTAWADMFVPPTAANSTAANRLPFDAVDTYSGRQPARRLRMRRSGCASEIT